MDVQDKKDLAKQVTHSSSGRSGSSKAGASVIEKLLPSSFIGFVQQERMFLVLIGLLFFIAGLTYETPHIAMWVGFFFAGYSAIANDSIQTIGTFLASNSHRKWWVLWLFIGGIFLATTAFSWFTYDGDVSYQRLTAKGFAEAPTSFSFLQVAAPLFLLIITRLRMPVSTTFLLLSCFSSDLSGIQGVLMKSLSGYFVAFGVALILWLIMSRFLHIIFKGEEPHPIWMPIQWITSGSLWAVWLMQDAANIAVYLPRSLSVNAVFVYSGAIFLGLGILFYLKGDKIQQIVTEKSSVTDVRAATIIDFVYAIILFYFKSVSVIPMSTTWVFIGLLAGREIAMSFTDSQGQGRPMSHSLKLLSKDAGYAMIGLSISIVLAMSINPLIMDEILALIK